MQLPTWFWPRPAAPTHLICYTRTGCCLCDRARDALDRLAARRVAHTTYVDIDGDDALRQAYGERIPVVVLGDEVVAEGKVSAVRLERLLRQRAPHGR